MITIRPIEKNDDGSIAKVIRQVLEENHLDLPGTAYFDPQLDYMYDYYSSQPTSQYWIAEDNGKILGGVGLEQITPNNKQIGPVAEVQKLYLSAAIRGNGLGRSLMDKLLAYANNHNYQYLYLETIHHLQPAISLYETLGFEYLDEPLLNNVHPLMDVFMLKDLGKDKYETKVGK